MSQSAIIALHYDSTRVGVTISVEQLEDLVHGALHTGIRKQSGILEGDPLGLGYLFNLMGEVCVVQRNAEVKEVVMHVGIFVLAWTLRNIVRVNVESHVVDMIEPAYELSRETSLFL